MMCLIIDDVAMQTFYQCIDMDDGECMQSYNTLEEAKSFIKGWNDVCNSNPPKKKSLSQLAPLPKAVPTVVSGWTTGMICPQNFVVQLQQEGTNPMRYNDNYASASASVSTTESDTSVQRKYLLNRLDSASYPKSKELQKLFNLYVNNTPKNFKDLIKVITAGTYTIDNEAQLAADQADADDEDFSFGGPLYGIIWPGPVPDWDGYNAAQVEQNKQATAARDIIMTSDAAAGLAALQAFEAWLPTVASASTSVASTPNA